MDVKYTLSKFREYGIWGTARKVFKTIYLNTFPDTINVEIMTVCNLKCKHCRVTYHGHLIPDVDIGFMKFDQFKRIVDRIILLIKHINLFQFSTIEPLFHKNIFKMMDYVSQHNKHIKFPILSNGMLLNEENIRSLYSRNVPSITISLDGCRKETVESFKTGADFSRIINNIRLLKEIAGEKIKIYTVFIATRNNIDELLDYVDFCNDLGVNTIYINGFLSFLPELSNLYLYSKRGNPTVFNLFQLAHKKAKNKGIFIKFPSLTAKPRGCDLSSYMCINEKGDVSPCILLARKTPFELFSKTGTSSPVIYGNVLTEEPILIWNKKEYLDFRNKLRKSIIPEECVLCADAYSVICSQRTLKP